MANREYSVNINNSEKDILQLYTLTPKEGYGIITYTNTINKESGRKLYLIPYSSNPSYAPIFLRGNLQKNKKSPDDVSSDSYDVVVLGNSNTCALTNENVVVGDNPAINLYKNAVSAYTFFSGNPESASLECTFTQGDEIYTLEAEIISTLDITGADVEYSGPYEGINWNGAKMAKSGADYGTYNYSDGVQTFSGTITGGDEFARVINDAVKYYDGTEASCLNINLSAVNTPILTGYGNKICVLKIYNKELDTIGRKFDNFSIESKYLYEVCDSFNEFDIANVIDGTNVTVDFTMASTQTTKYLFVCAGCDFVDDLTVTKDGSTFDKEVVQCIKITYTP